MTVAAAEHVERRREQKRRSYHRHSEKNKERNRRNLRLRLYGVTQDAYDAMLAKQGGVCAICCQPETSMVGQRTRTLSVDHDHRTNKVRALLCLRCNAVLGKMEEKPDLFLAAVRYLREHGVV